jgi:hypothetical protein
MLRSALSSNWNTGYIACHGHLKRVLSHLPKSLVDQRLSILSIYANAILSARDAALEPAGSPVVPWAAITLVAGSWANLLRKPLSFRVAEEIFFHVEM